MTGRFLRVSGFPVSIGGNPNEILLAFDIDANAWIWASGQMQQTSLESWNSPGSAVTVGALSTGASITGNTPTVVLETGSADKKFVLSSTGQAPTLHPRWVDASNFVAWNPQLTGSTGRLRTRTAGSNTDETSAALYSSATNWGIEVIGNTINMYGNGVLVATRTVTAHASSTKAAIGHQNASGTVTVTRLQDGTIQFV